VSFIVVIPVIRYRALCPHTRSLETARAAGCRRPEEYIVQQVFKDNEEFWSVQFDTRHVPTHIIIIYISSVRNLLLMYIFMDLL